MADRGRMIMQVKAEPPFASFCEVDGTLGVDSGLSHRKRKLACTLWQSIAFLLLPEEELLNAWENEVDKDNSGGASAQELYDFLVCTWFPGYTTLVRFLH